MSKRQPSDPEGSDSSGLEKPRRKHRATGNPVGGQRDGAGRPPGAANALPQGAVAAIRAARLRVPASASPEAAEAAGRAFERIVDVMEERVSPFGAFSVLTAAKTIREEVCGPISQKVELGGKGGGAVVVEIHKLAPGGE